MTHARQPAWFLECRPPTPDEMTEEDKEYLRSLESERDPLAIPLPSVEEVLTAMLRESMMRAKERR